MDKNQFYLEIAEALAGCQLVEQQLKLYISESFELAKKCIGNRLFFKFSGEDYEDSALETLIKTFKKLNDNYTLSQNLEKFKIERNFLSHRGITYCLDPDLELSDPEAEEIAQKLISIKTESHRLFEAIHSEANKFRGHLWFD